MSAEKRDFIVAVEVYVEVSVRRDQLPENNQSMAMGLVKDRAERRVRQAVIVHGMVTPKVRATIVKEVTNA